MMKCAKVLMAVAVVLFCCTASTLKSKEKPVYAFGLAASFNDTIVYCTEIQLLDSVELKDGFLPAREMYAEQLKNYLEYEKQKPNYTCMIYFSENKKKLEKDAVKIKNKYQKGSTLLMLEPAAFTFTKPQEY